MAQQADRKRPAPRLYLITPPVGAAGPSPAAIVEAARAADAAAVLLQLAPAGERDLINLAKSIAAAVQPTGAALVLDGHPDIAARAGADGAHLTGLSAFAAAVESLKPARIAGCGGLKTRHDAMLAAEQGADYVMFGEPEPSGQRPSFQAIVERVEWWAELFEVPCVGFAQSPDEVERLAAAGADFVAVGDWVWSDPQGAAGAASAAAKRLGKAGVEA